MMIGGSSEGITGTRVTVALGGDDGATGTALPLGGSLDGVVGCHARVGPLLGAGPGVALGVSSGGGGSAVTLALGSVTGGSS
jgi:hypothetical protein